MRRERRSKGGGGDERKRKEMRKNLAIYDIGQLEMLKAFVMLVTVNNPSDSQNAFEKALLMINMQ